MEDRNRVENLAVGALNRSISRRGILKRAVALGLAVPAIGALLTACEDDEADDAVAVDPDEDDADDEPVAEDDEPDDDIDADTDDEPADGDEERTLVIAVPGDIQNLDPTLSSGDLLTQEVLTAVYSFLIDFEVTEEDGVPVGDPNSFVGDVAESFEFSDDGTVVTFHIREGLQFSNGDPLDANAVKFTYDRVFGQGGVTAALTSMAAVEDADSIQAIDDLTVEFTLSQANELLLGNMTQFGHSILNPNVVEEHMTDDDPWAHDWLRTNTTDTESGPYVMESWEPDNQIVLRRNPNYWREVKNDRIILQIIPDASSRMSQVAAGSVDLAYEIPTENLEELEDNPDLTVHANTTRAVTYIGMNNEIEPFDDVLVRQAISYAVPYETIINNVIHGYGSQLTGPIPEGTPSHTDEFFVYEDDPDRARELLEEAGYGDGLELTLTIPNDSAEDRDVAVWVQSNLREIGVDLTIDEMPRSAFNERKQRHEHAFFVDNWISITNDALYHVFWLLRSECCNYARYGNEEVWDLIDTYMLSDDEDERDEAAREVQRLAVEDAAWVFLYQPDLVIVTQADIHGYTFYSADRYMRYQHLYKEGWDS
jgi:peptide/nickel transport system substrate-binding protein